METTKKIKVNNQQENKDDKTLSILSSGDTKQGGIKSQDDTKLQFDERSASLPVENHLADTYSTAENKQSGMYWHCHHDRLCEYVWDYQERVDYIKTEKPKNEIETRLRLFKKVKGKLPKEFDKEARKKCVEGVEAGKKLDEAGKKYAPQIEALHKKECGCKEWNGKEIVFK